MAKETRILILEDVPNDAELAQREINKSLTNCIFKTVDNKEDFLKTLSNFMPDIILSDYRLPGFDGLSALRLSREHLPQTPFIIFTGSQNEDIAVECMKAGANDYVIKEHLKRLGAIVVSVLETKKLELEQEKTKNEALSKQKEYEQKLIESEARSKAFLTSNPDLMFMFSEDGTVIDCIAEDKSLLINSPSEIIGKNITDLVNSHLADLAIGAIQKVKETNNAVTYEYELSVGKAEYFESRFVRCGADKYLNIVRDITPGKLVEMRLQASEAKYKALLEANPDLMFLLSEDGVFLEYKANSNENLFVPPEQFLGRNIQELFAKNISNPTLESIKIAKQTGEIQTFEYELTTNDIKYYECRLVPCGSNKYLVIVRDITERRRFEKQLKDSEEKYRKIFETSNEGILCIDANCNIILLNQKTADMLGYSKDEILGKSLEYFMYAEDLADHEQRVAERTAGKVGSYERRYRCKDGTTLWAIVSATPEFDDDGNFTGSFGMLTDITDRKGFEGKLRENEEKYRTLFETANEGIIGVGSDGKTTFANQKMASMLGYTIDEMVGKTATDLIFPEDMQDYQVKTQERIAGEHGHYDRKLKKKDGSAVWFNVSATPVVKKDGVGVESYAMYTDITDRKQQEKALEDTVERFKIQRQIMKSISTSHDVENGNLELLAAEICEKASLGGNYHRVAVWFYEEDGAKLRCINMYDLKTQEHSQNMILYTSGYHAEYEYLKTANYFACDDPWNDEKTKTYRDNYIIPNNVSSLLDATIRGETKLLGIICFEFFETPHQWQQDEISFACQLADQISLAIANKKRIVAEQDLQDSEDRYKQIAELAPIGIAIHSEGKVVYANPASAKIMGAKSPSEIIGTDIINIVHPEFVDKLRDRLKRLAAGEIGLYPTEEVFVKKDGSYFDVEVNSSTIEYKNKPAYQVIVSDITERKKAETIAKRNEQRLKSIIDILQHKTDSIQELVDYALSEAIKLTESSDGFLFFYEEDTKTLNYSLLGAANLNMVNTLENPGNIKISPTGFWSEVIKQRKPIINNNYVMPGDSKAKLPPGHMPLKRMLSLPVIVGDKIVVVAGVVNKKTDYDEMDVLQITLLLDSVWKVIDVKQNEHELRKLNRAVEQSPVSIIITDVDGKIEYVNDFFTKITGYSITEVAGQNPRILKTGKTSQETYSDMWQTILAGKTWSGEFHNKKKNGEFYWEYASISPVTNPEGKVINFIAVKEDITRRKQITEELIQAKEEAEQMSRIKSSFLANMSHELRTPMVGILGYSELLNTMVQEEEIKEMANTINISGKRLLHTLNQILDLSRVEANLQEIHWEVIELNSFLRDKVRLFEVVSMKKGLTLSFISKHNNILLKTDSRLLEHVVNDLINNAIKYTDTGKIDVCLEIEKTESGNHLQIKIIDTGIGIPHKHQDTIFDAFRQVSEGLNRSFEGTGLGLTISKRYIELLGGKISLISKVGSGSTFIVSFPESKDIKVSNTHRTETVKEAHMKTEVVIDNVKLPHILLVDDDEISFILIQRMLKGLVELDYAENGLKALDLMHKNIYSMVLLDINLPGGMGGLEVLAKIKVMKEYKKVPIVAVTAYSMVGDRETFLAKGCTHYLSKPFTKNDLVGLLSYIR